jgi:hypothetical protein
MRLDKRAAFAVPLLIWMSPFAFGQAQPSSNAFNPAISLILNGRYTSYSLDPAGYRIPGFLLEQEAGLPSEGLSLDETELAISANVDDKFYGSVSASIEQTNGETSGDLEEAFFETLALPKGFKIKAGRFLSDIGYLNPIHAHAWDFADAPLAYVAMLNAGYSDTGVQGRWVAPTTLFFEVGAELFSGDTFPAANGADSNGTGAWTMFAHVGGDVGSTSSWRAGLSHQDADANGRVSSLGVEPNVGTAVFTGSSELTIADFVWKWAKNGNPRDRYYVVQAEYLHRKEDGAIEAPPPLPVILTGGYAGKQSGFYVQGVYQFRPRWRAGLRYDRLEASNTVDTELVPLFEDHSPSRESAMVDFSNSEFSRFRLQYNRDDSRQQADDQIVLQYTMSLGAHGAHRF